MGGKVKTRGLILLYTGDGKGKTSAAFGQALRAAGHGMAVCIIQFIKKNTGTGEVKAMEALAGRVEVHTIGSGFTWEAAEPDEPKNAALAGWALAMDKIASRRYAMIVLDEFTYPLLYGYLDEAAVFDVLRARPPEQHLVITGRAASQELIGLADLVTELREIKHPYQTGSSAVRGIEF